MESPLTHAVLIEPDDAGELQPLLEQRAFAMLPLANRPLIHHLLARLAAGGIREVDLFLSHHPQQTRDYVAAGEAWGLAVRCHSIGGSERLWMEPGRLWRCVRDASLVIGLDGLPDLATLERLIQARIHGSRWLVGAESVPLRIGRLVHGSSPLKEPPAGRVRLLRSARNYLDANLDALAALGDGHHIERQLAPTLFAGARARIDETAQLTGTVLLGAGAAVGLRCTLGDGTVVGTGVLLDDNVEVRDSVLLDDTYVGPHGLLQGKIVDRGCVIDCASGLTLHVDDVRILGSTREHLFSEQSLHRLWERALALGCLLLLAPALAGWVLLRRALRRPLFERQTVYLAPRRTITGELQARPLALLTLAGVSHPSWQRSPWLLSVLRGQIPLVGPALPATRSAAAANVAGGHGAMLSCASPAAPAALAQLDFLRDAGPALSTRTVLGWLMSLICPAPEGVCS